MGVCQFVVEDLLQNKRWNSALELQLGDTSVVGAREYPDSPLVVFIPVSDTVKLADMTMQLNRVKQLALELSTGEVTIEKCPDDGKCEVKKREEHVDDPPVLISSPYTNLMSPDIFTPLLSFGRFKVDHSFDRDKCLRLHQEVLHRQFEHENARDETNRKRARHEEIRLGLTPDNLYSDSEQSSENLPHSSNTDNEIEDSTSTSALVDIHTSVMFVFHDGPSLSYFQAAAGLAPPQMCPDDSDDEKPLDVVQQEQKQALRKRKADE